jgi:flagellar hook-associated protein 2
MSGIQISGLVSNSAFDWKSVVDQLIAADSIPMTGLQTQQTTNTSQVTALGSLKTSLLDLQTSLQNLRSGDMFGARTVLSDNANTSWQSTSASGATLGSYAFAVQQLATKAQIQGTANIGSGLSATSDVSGLTLANLNTATAVTAGVFTVNGQQVTIDTTDSLNDVFNKIATATGGDVTAAYDPTADKITLASASNSEVLLGAANDTSNFFSVMKLSNTGTSTTTSSAALGTLKLSAPLSSSALGTALTGLDASDNGSFQINGVTINYNADTDTISTLMSRINQSTAGVTASYDSANDQFTLANTTTGDVGLGLSDTSGNLLAALGLTTAAGGAFTHGKNAQFTINGGATLTSASNTLDSSVTGISGFSLTVNSQTTETLQIQSNTAPMQSAIQDVVDKFNALQTAIQTDTQTTFSGGTVTTSVLSNNEEAKSWAENLQNLAFDAVSGLTGSVQRMDNLGIDFDGTSGQLVVKDSSKLANALTNNPQDVQNFFLTANTGFVSKMYGYLITAISENGNDQSQLTQANTDLGTQITTMQSRLDDERTQLTNSFIAMLDAQSTAQTQSTTLTNAFFNKNNSSS